MNIYNWLYVYLRKSPVVDGRVKRDMEGLEVRYPVILSSKEKDIARKIVKAFGQIGTPYIHTYVHTYIHTYMQQDINTCIHTYSIPTYTFIQTDVYIYIYIM